MGAPRARRHRRHRAPQPSDRRRAARYRGTWFRRETLDGITVFRNWLYATPNEGFVKRTLGHLSFMASTLVFTLPRARRFDVLVVSSPAFFVVISTW